MFDNVAAVEEFEELKRVMRSEIARGNLTFAFDTETLGLRHQVDRVIGYSFACGVGSWYVDIYDYRGVDYSEARGFLIEIFSNSSITLVGANIKFDINMVRAMGVECKCSIHELQAMSSVIDERRPKKLEEMAKFWTGEETATFHEVRGFLGGLFHSKFNDYGRKDARITWNIFEKIYPLIDSLGKREVYEILRTMSLVAAEMEWNGFLIDQDEVDRLEEKYKKIQEDSKSEVFRLAGEEFNIDSSEQVFFYCVKLGIDLGEYGAEESKKKSTFKRGEYAKLLFGGRQNRSHKPDLIDSPWYEGSLLEGYTTRSTSADILSLINHPFTKAVCQYKKASKVLTAFIPSFRPRDIRSTDGVGVDPDGRLRSSFNPNTARTGRWSCTSPNQQQQPKDLRTAFVASPGCRLIVADYSNLELRVIAHYTNDETLVYSYKNGINVHKDTQAKLGISYAAAKACNFALAYLTGPKNLAKNLQIPLEEAQEITKSYFKLYKGIKSFHRKAKKYIESSFSKFDSQRKHLFVKRATNGYVDALKKEPRVGLLYGRERHLGNLDQNKSMTTLVNTKIQGTAGDIMNSALMLLYEAVFRSGDEKLSSVKFLAQVHDEIVLEVEDNQDIVDYVTGVVRDCMENSIKKVHKKFGKDFDLNVPLVADIKSAYTWAEAK